jgi:hypothetical protein
VRERTAFCVPQTGGRNGGAFKDAHSEVAHFLQFCAVDRREWQRRRCSSTSRRLSRRRRRRRRRRVLVDDRRRLSTGSIVANIVEFDIVVVIIVVKVIVIIVGVVVAVMVERARRSSSEPCNRTVRSNEIDIYVPMNRAMKSAYPITPSRLKRSSEWLSCLPMRMLISLRTVSEAADDASPSATNTRYTSRACDMCSSSMNSRMPFRYGVNANNASALRRRSASRTNTHSAAPQCIARISSSLKRQQKSDENPRLRT